MREPACFDVDATAAEEASSPGSSASASSSTCPAGSRRRCSPPPRRPPGVARTRARRPHRRSVRHARPGDVDRSRPGVRDRPRRRRPRAALRDRRRRVLRPARRPGRRRGVAARRHRVPARASGRRLYPPALSEGAASLLPDGPRPAVVFTVRVGPDGDARLDGVERAVVHSRAKLAYEPVARTTCRTASPSSPAASSSPRSAGTPPRVEFPDQELERVDGGWELRFRPRLRERGSERGDVAGHQPGRRRCAPRRRHRAVPGDARARRAGDPPAAPHAPRRSG